MKDKDLFARRLSPFVSIFFGFLIGFLLLLILGYNPLAGFAFLFEGGIIGMPAGDLRQFGNVLLSMTPLVLTGLSIAFAFKTGLFNIGVAGQMLFGGFLAVAVGNRMDLPRALHLPLLLLASMAGGALWAAVPGILKATFRINEVVTGIMMNYIALWGVRWFSGRFIPGSDVMTSAPIRETATLRALWLTNLFTRSNVNYGLFAAFAACLLVWFILEKTTFGYELKAVGFNQHAADYAGMKATRSILYSMLIAGALAGLAGATHYAGFSDRLTGLGWLPSQGFDGIAVALLGLNSPLGVLLAAFFLGYMNIGGAYMQIMARIPAELVSIIVSTIIYFAALSQLIEGWLKKWSNKNKRDGGAL
ncbi:MAG: ABC transporter permease [Turicibacter sp.]|nr:ABC transporter permease [Turicibacter sp.]